MSGVPTIRASVRATRSRPGRLFPSVQRTTRAGGRAAAAGGPARCRPPGPGPARARGAPDRGPPGPPPWSTPRGRAPPTPSRPRPPPPAACGRAARCEPRPAPVRRCRAAPQQHPLHPRRMPHPPPVPPRPVARRPWPPAAPPTDANDGQVAHHGEASGRGDLDPVEQHQHDPHHRRHRDARRSRRAGDRVPARPVQRRLHRLPSRAGPAAYAVRVGPPAPSRGRTSAARTRRHDCGPTTR